MGRTVPVKIPTVKVKKAKELQSLLASQGRFLSLYECLLAVEQEQKDSRMPEPFRRFRL